jgi:xanthine dehydrogenase accessory factor
MKEIKEIIRSYKKAVADHKKTALATVVHVEGSSYRRAGARMLVTEDGVITGAISGGCLEGDALRKAQFAIQQAKNKLVTYDTTDDDATLGVQLGCNGIVHILFEPLHAGVENVIDLLVAFENSRKTGVVATLFCLQAEKDQPGTIAAFAEEHSWWINGALPSDAIRNSIEKSGCEAVAEGLSRIEKLESADPEMLLSLQLVKPPISLVVFGAGNDAVPLVNLGNLLGWTVTVVDGRPNYASKQRFPMADRIIVAKSAAALEQISVDSYTATVVMSHNYNYDLRIVQALSRTNCRYVGVLGPRKKMDKMYDELQAEGFRIPDEVKTNIYSPIGLDIGAETSEEIALSVAAEIQAALSSAPAESLRKKVGPIHPRAGTLKQ